MFKITLSSPALIFAIFILPGCLETSGTSATSIPNLTVECASVQVNSPYCRGNSDVMWLGLTDDFNLDCADVLSNLTGSSRNQLFQAIASNVTFTHLGGISNANISSFQTSSGAAVATLLPGSYKACAFIETTGGNQRLGLNEPLGAAIVQVGGESPQLVNDWIPY